MKFIQERAKGRNYAEAAVAAGYSEKNARQSGYQAMEQLRGRVPDLLDLHGLSEGTLIDKYLRPLLEAEDTIFFQKDGKVRQRVKVPALSIRHSALRTAFELHGSYAPRLHDNKAQDGPPIRFVMDLPRPDYSKAGMDRAIDVKPTNEPANILESGTGHKPDPRPKD